jgi:hypothetical protein
MGKTLSLDKAHFGHAFLVAMSSPRIMLSALGCTYTVIKDFFLSQSPLRPKKIKPPYVWIDHELDDRIPFAPEWVNPYFRFIPMWVCGVSWYRLTFGRRTGGEVAETVRQFRRLYKEAARVYRKCQSTTKRPPAVPGNRAFGVIHKMDPHLNCLPSLHVMVVTFAAWRLSRIIREAAPDENLYRREIDALYAEARQITESVLYVKQHSVNCIPAALFAMRHIQPGFETEFGEGFMNSLFDGTLPVIEGRSDVSRHLVSLYREFNAAWETGKYPDFQAVLLEFLGRYLEEPASLKNNLKNRMDI